MNGLDDESMLLCLSNRTLPLPPSCSLTLKRKGEANLNFRGERREESEERRGVREERRYMRGERRGGEERRYSSQARTEKI